MNYSILQKNTLDGLSEMAGCLYLSLFDKLRDEKKAFRQACVFEDKIGGVLSLILLQVLTSPDFPKGNLDELYRTLSKFFADRWLNNFMEN